jgi:hypothetical protein
MHRAASLEPARTPWASNRDPNRATWCGWSSVPSQPHVRLVQPGSRHGRPVAAWLLILDRLAARHAYLIVTACFAGILVSAGLAAAEIADYPNGVGYLAILGMITGAVGGLAAVVVAEETPRGWVYLINIAAAWLALISVAILVLLFMGQHGWYGGGA